MPIMPYSKSPAVSYLIYTLYAVAIAAIYGLFTYFGVFARGPDASALRTYIWNLVLIALVLIIDKVYISKVRNSANERKQSNRKIRVKHFISFKASLYIFYIFALTASRLILLSDYDIFGFDVETAEHLRSYFLSIEFGLILLVSADKFIDQFVKDKKLMREIAER